MPHRPSKIVSGGQTGVDRAALDIALRSGIHYGGHVPKGRLAEDGRIPERYSGLIETATDNPAERTRANVLNSDATLVISNGELYGGSRLTTQIAVELGKPVLHVDLALQTAETNLSRTEEWIEKTKPQVLNIAGPRASEDPRIYAAASDFLARLLY